MRPASSCPPTAGSTSTSTWGRSPARYLAFHAPRAAGQSERLEDRQRDQIEYPDEDPFIREKFESELAQGGMTSLMPDRAYTDREYAWTYDGEG